MNRLTMLLLASVFATGAAQAADATKDETRAAPKAARAGTAPTAIGSGAPQLAGLSQQNKMKECNKLATGKKGAERKGFMKTCLSKKKA